MAFHTYIITHIKSKYPTWVTLLQRFPNCAPRCPGIRGLLWAYYEPVSGAPWPIKKNNMLQYNLNLTYVGCIGFTIVCAFFLPVNNYSTSAPIVNIIRGGFWWTFSLVDVLDIDSLKLGKPRKKTITIGYVFCQFRFKIFV